MPVYLILGATGGIGTALTRKLAPTADLVLGARTESDLRTLADSLPHSGGETRATTHTLDATQYDEVQGIVDAAVEQHGRIDGAINLVGSILLKPAHLTSTDEFAETVALNLNSAFFLVKAATRAMQRNKDPEGGAIVLMSSVAAQLGLANHEAIAAAKGGINGLTKAAAASYAPRQIRVNAVAPGLVRTPMSERLTSSDAAEKASAQMHPLGRIGEPDDLVDALHFLLDREQSAWVTGQVLSVDGGFATVRPR
jgi:NAD(P)-dependent dehydrogenase (short-subunit alcohol dehydrogenase family)